MRIYINNVTISNYKMELVELIGIVNDNDMTNKDSKITRLRLEHLVSR